MADRDELTPALARTWNGRLEASGFRRVGKRDLQVVSDGIVRLLHFHVSSGGARDFCVHVAAFVVCANEQPVLQPGFRLRDVDGADRWWPAKSAAETAESVELAWTAAQVQALPWLARNATLEGHLDVLRGEKDSFGSQHHLHFQIGVVEALLGRREDAARDLRTASRLYAEDGRAWCAPLAARAESLIVALRDGEESALLERWRTANLGAHRIRGER